ncbi:MAG: DUF1189 family protein [Candidatus Paceibacterota bacterium]
MFKLIKQSIYNPAFYRSLLERPLSWSLFYFFKLAIIAALILTMVASFTAVPALVNVLSDLKGEVLNIYPAELEIVIENGQVRSNVSEPYFIDLPPVLADQEVSEDIDHLLVIDTTAEPLAGYDKYNAYALLTDRHLVYRQNSNLGSELAVVVQPLADNLTLTINRENLITLFDHLSRYFVIIPPLFVLGLFISSLIPILAVALYLLLPAALLWLVYALTRPKGRRLTFGNIYRTTLQAVTLGLLLKVTLIGLGLSPYLPFFLTLVTIAVVLFNVPLTVKEIENSPAPESEQNHTTV